MSTRCQRAPGSGYLGGLIQTEARAGWTAPFTAEARRARCRDRPRGLADYYDTNEPFGFTAPIVTAFTLRLRDAVDSQPGQALCDTVLTSLVGAGDQVLDRQPEFLASPLLIGKQPSRSTMKGTRPPRTTPQQSGRWPTDGSLPA